MFNLLLAWLMADGPRWRYNRIWLHALLAAVGLTVMIWALGTAVGLTLSEVFAENAAHELAQSALLGIALIVGVGGIFRSNALNRYAALVTAGVSAIGFVRETPNCRGDVMVFCASADTRGSLITASAVVLLVATLVIEFRGRGTFMKAIHPRFSWPLAFAAVLLALSQMAEGLHMVVVEETLELYGYAVLMLGAAWLALVPSSPQVIRRGRDRSGHADVWDDRAGPFDRATPLRHSRIGIKDRR